MVPRLFDYFFTFPETKPGLTRTRSRKIRDSAKGLSKNTDIAGGGDSILQEISSGNVCDLIFVFFEKKKKERTATAAGKP